MLAFRLAPPPAFIGTFPYESMSLNKIKQSCESPNLTTRDEWKHKTKLKYFQSLPTTQYNIQHINDNYPYEGFTSSL